MTEEKSWLTCKEASKLLDYSQRHIVNLINKGKLSANKDENGRYYIDKSEFFRVYPDIMTKKIDGTGVISSEDKDIKILEEKIKSLQDMLNEKRRQNDFLTEQLNNVTEEKSKMLDAINNHTRLLEYKEKDKNSQPQNKKRPWWKFKKDE